MAPITTMIAMTIQMMEDLCMGVLLSLDELRKHRRTRVRQRRILQTKIAHSGSARANGGADRYCTGGTGIAGVLCRIRSRWAE